MRKHLSVIAWTIGFAGLAGFCGLCRAPRAAAAEGQYRGLPLSPDEIYEAVLGYAADQNFAALGSCLNHFPVLLDVLGKYCGEDLRAQLDAATARRDPVATRQLLLKMIFTDFSLNLSEAAAATDRAARRERLEMAYVDFTFLERDATGNDSDLPKEVRTTLSRLVHAEEPEGIDQRSRALRARVSRVIPHCETPKRTPTAP